MKRREFIGAALTAGLAASTASVRAQEGAAALPARGGGRGGQQDVKTWTAKVEKLFKVQGCVYANAMESAPDGFWVGDQVSEKIYKADWQTGKVLLEVQTESHNMSGLGVGGGYIWAGSNGGVSGRRPARPTDQSYGELSQMDMKTGKIVKLYRPAWGGGMHGVTYNQETGKLWVAALSLQAVAEMDPKDNMRILRIIRTAGQRQHGLDVDKQSLYMLFATDHEVHRYDLASGRLMEVAKIPITDPDAHGLCLHDGYLYYCDSGLTDPGPGSATGMICRFRWAA